MDEQLMLFSTVNAAPVRGWVPSEPPSLDGINTVVLDCETSGLKWREGDLPVGIGIYNPAIGKRYLPWGHTEQNLDEDVVKRWAQCELRGKHIVNLNIKFDLHMLREWGVDLEEQGCTFEDVGHSAALLDDHRRKFNLEQLSQDMLGQGKVEGLDVTKMIEYPASQVAPYAEQDVLLPWLLREHMRPLLDAEDLGEVQQLECDVIPAVVEMERNGAPINEELLDRWIGESEQEYLRCLWQIHRECGVRVNPNKNAEMAKLFQARGLPITHYTDNGKPSFSDDVLCNYSDPMVKLVRQAKKIDSLRSKYLLPYRKAILNGVLYYNLHQLRTNEGGTVSGRFSASSTNIQQVMAVAKQVETYGIDSFIIRELFVPADGLMFAADARQIEYRIFVHLAQAERLLAEYAKNPLVNYHEIVARMVAEYREGVPYKQIKNLNFAFLYGAGIMKIALMLGIPYEEAASLVEVYHQAFPDVKRMLNKAMRIAETRGYVHTILGRRARFPEKKRAHKALNNVIQGSAADINKKKIRELHEARKRLGIKLRLTIHDEVVGDAPDQEAAREVAKILDFQSTKLRVPILWEMKTGENWRECA